jgi:cytoskeletal protein CcmA (bactofilin family)
MFSKSNAPKAQQARPEATHAPIVTNTPSPAAARPAPRMAASALGAGLLFEGTISGDADLSIEGVVKGDVHVTRLIVGEQATVEGQIRAQQVEVRGRVVGDIQAQAVKLAESAHVEGDITHGQLSIDVGAYFQGRCQQFRRPDAATPPETHFGGAPPEAPLAQVVEFDSARG